MAPLPLKLRQQPPSGFGAVGRAAVASGAGAGHEAQHRAYLQLLQERNQRQRHLRQEDEHRQGHQLRREQGFNVCFSGANSSRRTASSSSYGSRLRDNHNGGARGGVGGGLEGEWGGGAWRQWEERTVEIKGNGGEIYAVRPSGERRDISASIDSSEKNARRQRQEDSTEKLRTSLGTTQMELKGLRRELVQVCCDGDNPSPTAPVTPLAGTEAEGSKCRSSASSSESPRATNLDERIMRLPQSWRSRLLGLLEEAEADVALKTAADVEPEALELTAAMAECLRATLTSPGDNEAVQDAADDVTPEVQADAADMELRTMDLLAAAEAVVLDDAGGDPETTASGSTGQ